MQYWILKSEPNTYAIHDLERDGRTSWEGVRNFQARNFIRDMMHKEDTVFFYHSACAEPGIVGLATVCTAAYPDQTAQNVKNTYFDPKATPEDPKWYAVDVCFTQWAPNPLSLKRMRTDPALKELLLLRKGNRLSVLPVPHIKAQHILTLLGTKLSTSRPCLTPHN